MLTNKMQVLTHVFQVEILLLHHRRGVLLEIEASGCFILSVWRVSTTSHRYSLVMFKLFQLDSCSELIPMNNKLHSVSIQYPSHMSYLVMYLYQQLGRERLFGHAILASIKLRYGQLYSRLSEFTKMIRNIILNWSGTIVQAF